MWPTIIWSQLEYTLGIICACVPVMGPIFGKFFARQSTKISGRSHTNVPGAGQIRRNDRDSNDHTYPLTAIGTSTFVRASETEQIVPGDHLQHDLEHGDPRTIQVSTGWGVYHAPKD